jgi:hypothetical protein
MWVSGRVASRSGSTIRQCLLQLRYRVVWAGRRSAHFERSVLLSPNAYSGATIRPALRGAKVKFKRGWG